MKSAFMIPALLLAATPAFGTTPVTGNWVTQDGKALVEIGQCGKILCGKIVRILKPTPGRPQTDINNPDAKLKNRPLIGLPILTGFTADGAEWTGTIYSPEEGKSYRSVLQRNANGTLKVKGCIAVFCQTQTWKPAR